VGCDRTLSVWTGGLLPSQRYAHGYTMYIRLPETPSVCRNVGLPSTFDAAHFRIPKPHIESNPRKPKGSKWFLATVTAMMLCLPLNLSCSCSKIFHAFMIPEYSAPCVQNLLVDIVLTFPACPKIHIIFLQNAFKCLPPPMPSTLCPLPFKYALQHLYINHFHRACCVCHISCPSDLFVIC
jgi:hypothetical protein